MGKSYKRHPVFKDFLSRDSKKFANRKLRRKHMDIADGGWYRRLTSQYDIFEYRSFFPYRQHVQQVMLAVAEYKLGKLHCNPEEQTYYSDSHWEKFYHRK